MTKYPVHYLSTWVDREIIQNEMLISIFKYLQQLESYIFPRGRSSSEIIIDWSDLKAEGEEWED